MNPRPSPTINASVDQSLTSLRTSSIEKEMEVITYLMDRLSTPVRNEVLRPYIARLFPEMRVNPDSGKDWMSSLQIPRLHPPRLYRDPNTRMRS